MSRIWLGATWWLASCVGVDGGLVAPDPGVGPGIEGPAARSGDTTPVYGGTLAANSAWVVAAEPAQDRVFVTDRTLSAVRATIVLPPGARPFRVRIDGNTAYVTLRGSGEVASIDLTAGTLIRRAPVCPEPRGVDLARGDIVVACASGELVTLSPELDVLQSWWLAPDLRDVVVTSTGTWVSQFRTAGILHVDPATETILAAVRPEMSQTEQTRSEPQVAWRVRGLLDGSVVVMHQAASLDPLGIDPDGGPGNTRGEEGGYGGAACIPDEATVSTHFTRVAPDGVHTGGAIAVTTLAYDFDVRGSVLAAPASMAELEGLALVMQVDGGVATSAPSCIEPLEVMALDGFGLPTSVAFVGDEVFALLRGPTAVVGSSGFLDLDPGTDGFDRFDPLQIFHRPTRAGISCASCHPEGQDDGHVWQFEGLGPRRTQNLAGGVSARAPFHWDGDFPTLDDLMVDVFSGRMGGDVLDPGSVDRLAAWLDGIPTVRSTPSGDAAAIERGRALFEDPALGCATCHRGAQYSDHLLHDVTGRGPAKTPSLLGVASHGPWMSDGCAETLLARFEDPACGGGDRHGTTSDLSDAQRRSLVAWLETL